MPVESLTKLFNSCCNPGMGALATELAIDPCAHPLDLEARYVSHGSMDGGDLRSVDDRGRCSSINDANTLLRKRHVCGGGIGHKYGVVAIVHKRHCIRCWRWNEVSNWLARRRRVCIRTGIDNAVSRPNEWWRFRVRLGTRELAVIIVATIWDIKGCISHF